MKIDEKKILEIILKQKYISQEDIDDAAKKSGKVGISTLDYLIENNYINEDLVGQAIAEDFGFPYADLNTNEPAKEQVLRIPENIARKFNVVLFKEDEKSVVVATDNPNDKKIFESLTWVFQGKKIEIAYSLKMDIEKCFAFYKNDLSARFSDIIKIESKVAPEMVVQIIEDAIDINSSDIHFEPGSEETLIRFRVDGMLQKVGRISSQYYGNIVNYLKVLSSLRIDEHRSAQDGAIRFEIGDQKVDVRLSIIPVVDGEKVVLRILSRHISELSIESLGLSENDQKIFESSIAKPFGMIIVSGPTGSGKTTTLYSLLKKIKNAKWIVSYDNVAQIKKLYREYNPLEFSYFYTAYKTKLGNEVLFFSNNLISPTQIRIGSKR